MVLAVVVVMLVDIPTQQHTPTVEQMVKDLQSGELITSS
jgi:hypothetical protein